MERNQLTPPINRRRRLDINRPPPIIIRLPLRSLEINKREPESEDDVCKHNRIISFSDTSPLRFMRRINFN